MSIQSQSHQVYDSPDLSMMMKTKTVSTDCWQHGPQHTWTPSWVFHQQVTDAISFVHLSCASVEMTTMTTSCCLCSLSAPWLSSRRANHQFQFSFEIHRQMQSPCDS